MPEGKSLPGQHSGSNFCRRWIRRIVCVSFVLLLCSAALLFYARSRVTAFTSEKPIELPKRFVSKAEVAKVEKRLEKISNQVAAGSKSSTARTTSSRIGRTCERPFTTHGSVARSSRDRRDRKRICGDRDRVPTSLQSTERASRTGTENPTTNADRV